MLDSGDTLKEPGMRFPTMALTALQTPVTVQVNEKSTSWYTQPIWLAIGGVALVVIILIAVLAGRAGRRPQ
jgi:hypothetical protein